MWSRPQTRADHPQPAPQLIPSRLGAPVRRTPDPAPAPDDGLVGRKWATETWLTPQARRRAPPRVSAWLADRGSEHADTHGAGPPAPAMTSAVATGAWSTASTATPN